MQRKFQPFATTYFKQSENSSEILGLVETIVDGKKLCTKSFHNSVLTGSSVVLAGITGTHPHRHEEWELFENVC